MSSTSRTDQPHEYRDVRCLYRRRVAFATGQRAIPARVDRDAVGDQLGIHVPDGGPCVAARTAGASTPATMAGASTRTRGVGVEPGRPDDCRCCEDAPLVLAVRSREVLDGHTDCAAACDPVGRWFQSRGDGEL